MHEKPAYITFSSHVTSFSSESGYDVMLIDESDVRTKTNCKNPHDCGVTCISHPEMVSYQSR